MKSRRKTRLGASEEHKQFVVLKVFEQSINHKNGMLRMFVMHVLQE